jgi:type I site-specific restriction endonuclease
MAKQLDLFKTRTSEVLDFVDSHSVNFTDDVIDMVNERLTEIFNDEGISDYDIQADIADALMKRISQNLQCTPEEWI